jgi:O-antigen ligase
MLLIFMWRLRMGARLLLPCAAVVVAVTSMPQIFFYRFQNALTSGGAGRLDIWKAGLSALSRYGLFGAGLDNFPVIYNEFAGRANRFQGFGRDPHNIFLGLWVETGIVGLLLLLAIITSHLADLRRIGRWLQRDTPMQLVAIEAACWGVLVASFFDNMLWRKAFWLVWILAGVAVQVVTCNLRVASAPSTDYPKPSLRIPGRSVAPLSAP